MNPNPGKRGGPGRPGPGRGGQGGRARYKGGVGSPSPYPYHQQPNRKGPKPPKRSGPRHNHLDGLPGTMPPVDPDFDPAFNGDLAAAQSSWLEVDGVLEMSPKGHGFLRSMERGLKPLTTDPFVPQQLIQAHKLREGLHIRGVVRPARGQGPRLGRIDQIENAPVAEYKPRDFESLTAVDPTIAIKLETGQEPLSTRVMDLLTPLGRGQRALIVAPPRTGKTVLLQQLAKAVSANHPDMHLMVLLVDERPEEVTEVRRTIRGEIFASSSDLDASNHVRLAELVVERAKRLAEQGKPVFLLLDSLTRLARAYNKNTGNSGRTMSGGVDVRALEVPKRLFGSARAFEEGGSLTVVGTALIDTGSKMDEVIFQELKGTGNMEMVLDRKLADRRVFPAMDISQSGTRKEERLISTEFLPRIHALRRVLVDMKPVEAMEKLVSRMAKTKSNTEFLEMIKLK
ncbi:MAG: transcription termination factor Rho [Gemmataceae bacterium]